MKVVAFVPLRGGGTRVGLIGGKDKERANFAGHPLMAYTICAAKQSGVFDEVIAITRSQVHKAVAGRYGAITPRMRPAYTIADDSPDIEWVEWATRVWGNQYDAFAILRVTSPFRRASDIQKAWHWFYGFVGADSLRMVRPVTEHPGKMWVKQNGVLMPLLPMKTDNVPWHSSPTQNLFPAYIQTAGMEFAYFTTVKRTGTISGSVIVPYVSDYWTGFDINTREEWFRAEKAALEGKIELPEVK
jgi:N-acylneuraminate cytidylyltransferase